MRVGERINGLLRRRRMPPAEGAVAGAEAALGPASEPWLLAFPPTATAADILSCFRLLLGRLPHREEWRGHSMRVGEALPGVVASYLQSLEFSRRRLLAPEASAGIVQSTVQGFNIFSAADDAAVGRYVQQDNYEADVTAVFRRFLRPGMGVIDIGANIGYFSLLSASLVGEAGYVLAIEPNPRNARLLEASRRSNGFAQICVSQTAAGPQTGLLVLHVAHSNGTTSALPEQLDAVLAADTVPCVAVDALVPGGQRIDFIKVDVEGAEYLALLGCQNVIRQHKPVIASEFSPNLMPGISGVDGEFYLHWLGTLGYQISIIAPDGSLQPTDNHWPLVLNAHAARATDHIDIVALPA